MSEELEQQIRRTLESLDQAVPPQALPTASQAWSRLQFRLAYRRRQAPYTSQAGTLLTALYVLLFLVWFTWSGWLSASLLVVLGAAVGASVGLLLHASRIFRN